MSNSIHTYWSLAIIVVIIVVTSSGCQSQNKASTTANAFSQLYLANSAKDFPRSLKALEHCQQTSFKPCLDLYHRVIEARNYLASQPREEVLDQIFSCSTEQRMLF